MAKLSFLSTKEFDKQLGRLRAEGGISFEMSKQVIKAVALWKEGLDADLMLTHHGESRIAHAVKYDLKGHGRLVTREHEGLRIALFVGTHEAVEYWLESNKGRDFIFNKSTGSVALASLSLAPEEIADESDSQRTIRSHGPMFDCIPKALWDKLRLPPQLSRTLSQHARFERCRDRSSYELLEALAYPNDETKQAILNAYLNLAQGQTEAAIAGIELLTRDAAKAEDDPSGFFNLARSGAASESLLDFDSLSVTDYERLIDQANFSEWMLYLSPDQRKLTNQVFSGPARVVGVSGSGKTCVLVHRANNLCSKYPGEKILILTLGRSLVRLIGHLLDQLCDSQQRASIEVVSIYDYCYQLVKAIEPDRLIERLDPISGENLSRCWHDFLRKSHARKNVEPIIAALEKREDPVRAPDAYVLEELIWIRSGFGKSERDDYLTCDRPGRGIPIAKWHGNADASFEYGSMPPDARRRLLNLLADYEEYMAVGGLLDRDGVSLEAFALRDRLGSFPQMRARCVLVDELQDISTNELAVIARVPTVDQDGLFLCGDPVQKVFPKQHNLVAAGIDIVGRGRVLQRNYRNTREILSAAFKIIREFASDASIPESEIIQPEFAFRAGQKPTLIECESRDEQIGLLMSFLQASRPEHLNATCVCSPRIETLEQAASECRARGIPTVWLTGEQRYDEIGLKLGELELVKGHEFASVYILDLSDRDLPAKSTPWEERWRDAFHIYVAMTRARDELTMMFVYNRSILLGPLQDSIDEVQAVMLLH